MRLQEHSVFDFDETVFPPPSVGGASPLSCAQAISVALGFALSAGWDWLPSMHILWLRDYIDTVGKSALTENFDMLSGSILFKMAILLALSPVMERLFLAFPPERVAFHQPPFRTPLVLSDDLRTTVPEQSPASGTDVRCLFGVHPEFFCAPVP